MHNQINFQITIYRSEETFKGRARLKGSLTEKVAERFLKILFESTISYLNFVIRKIPQISEEYLGNITPPEKTKKRSTGKIAEFQAHPPQCAKKTLLKTWE